LKKQTRAILKFPRVYFDKTRCASFFAVRSGGRFAQRQFQGARATRRR
jgi:hypothetical protein